MQCIRYLENFFAFKQTHDRIKCSSTFIFQSKIGMQTVMYALHSAVTLTGLHAEEIFICYLQFGSEPIDGKQLATLVDTICHSQLSFNMCLLLSYRFINHLQINLGVPLVYLPPCHVSRQELAAFFTQQWTVKNQNGRVY